jgi:serine/threonine-protein kinase ATR
MIDAFGPTGSDGIYASTLKATMSVLRENRDTLLSVLEPFVKDPVINWKKHRASQQRTSSGIRVASHSDRSKEDAKQKMSVIDERLRGIYNLRNPNLSRILRKDGIKYQSDEELRNELPLSVEGQVHKLIAEATSHENLVQLYVGWMPWV